MARPKLSLIVPTRGRPEKLRTFLDSVARTTLRPDRLEIVLVIDWDDFESREVTHPRLHLIRAFGPADRTMGELNRAGYAASSGEYIMLLNDDVIIRTRGWDRIVLKQFRWFPDPFVLVHVNDLLISHHLCVFPLVSRAFCELAGGICPKEYRRYRIDDHIEDPFNMLALLGVKRTVYLPDVVFEHLNATSHVNGQGVYHSDPELLAEDAWRFDARLVERKKLALRLHSVINPASNPTETKERLDEVTDSFALRIEGRQRIVRLPLWKRLNERFRLDGFRGVARSLHFRFSSTVVGVERFGPRQVRLQ